MKNYLWLRRISGMNEVKSDEKKRKKQKSRAVTTIALLAGLLGGAVLGIFVGIVVQDIPLYTGFGMLLGLAITFDMTAHLPDK